MPDMTLSPLMTVVQFAAQKFAKQCGGFGWFFKGGQMAAGGKDVEMCVRQFVRQGFANSDRDKRVIHAPQHQRWHGKNTEAGDGIRP
jgi:hypothetical protein